jgi:DNA invertase Pin-like site-specific DNA recombinase
MGVLAQVSRFESKRRSERLRSKHRELREAGAWQGGQRVGLQNSNP